MGHYFGLGRPIRERGENWVWHGATCLYPAETRCMVALSRGGADADVKREFDVESKSFVEDGFFLPEAKSEISWIDADTLFVSTDFGEGTLTNSGYPRVAKKWSRDTELTDAQTVFEGEQQDIWIGAYHDPHPGFERTLVYQGLTFYTNNLFLETKKGLIQIDKQDRPMPLFGRIRCFLNCVKIGRWMEPRTKRALY